MNSFLLLLLHQALALTIRPEDNNSEDSADPKLLDNLNVGVASGILSSETSNTSTQGGNCINCSTSNSNSRPVNRRPQRRPVTREDYDEPKPVRPRPTKPKPKPKPSYEEEERPSYEEEEYVKPRPKPKPKPRPSYEEEEYVKPKPKPVRENYVDEPSPDKSRPSDNGHGQYRPADPYGGPAYVERVYYPPPGYYGYPPPPPPGYWY